jgi:outer membrane protein OmpA-like peptidoglycan-associated protein
MRATTRLAAGAATLGLLLTGASPAGAEADRGFGIDANLFKPAMDSNGFFTIERAQGMKRYDFTLRLGSTFSQEPLSIDTVGGMSAGTFDGTVDPVLDYQLGFDFGFAFGLSDKLTFGFQIPVLMQPLGSGYGTAGRYMYDPADPNRPPTVGTGFYSSRAEQNVLPSENGPGDLRIGLKYTLTSKMAIQVIGYVPFGDEDVFAGSGSGTLEPRFIYDMPLGKKGHLALNAGVRIREGELAETRQVDPTNGEAVNDPMTGDAVYLPRLFVGTEAAVGVGFVWDVSAKFAAGIEANVLVPILTASDTECGGDCKNGDLTGDVLGGFQFGLGADKKLGVGAGTAIIPDAARSPGFRVAVSFTWTPSVESGRAAARGDSDGDGLSDGQDVCPDEPEDNDNFQDDDGCPELDNDLDGVLDAQDKCAAEPEDRDGFDDGDGCPEGDNDKDDVPDLTDRCPGEKEDRDGFEDDDGCPDEDNDGDGFVDAKDQCPDEAETLNGYQDLDGCPDQALQGGPKLAAGSIDLQGERIEFQGKTDKLTKASEATLDNVATVMKQNPNIRFRIEVGVEESGKAKKNKDADRRLSNDRADAVRAYLVKKGVEPRQLDVSGLGSDRPIDAKDPKSQKNRRVEFIRLNQ